MDAVRVDKWLWAVRLFKTRAQAAGACRLSRVRIGEHDVKPSRTLKIGEVVVVEKDSMRRTVKVVQFLEKRVAAACVADYLEELTPESEWQRARDARAGAAGNRVFQLPGIGRPTKKYRRQIEDYLRESSGTSRRRQAAPESG